MELDLILLTETWIKDNNYDRAWVLGSSLNTDGYTFDNSFNRPGRQGGGLALIYNEKQFKIKQISKGQTESFKYTVWEISQKNSRWHLVGIYHPPPSQKNASNITFLDEFSDYIGELRDKYVNLLIAGQVRIQDLVRGPSNFFQRFANDAQRRRVSEASIHWPGSRARLRALEALVFISVKYAFSHFSWYLFFKNFKL